MSPSNKPLLKFIVTTENVQNAIEYLKIIGALDQNENLTVLVVFVKIALRLRFSIAVTGKHNEKSFSLKTMEDGQVLMHSLLNPRMDIHMHHELLSAVRLLVS
ncbi:hypothetical protein NC652_021376 [Populus alba x Populus x berolinensis]|nr:hypothetical protein NC652_021376 [Populus alba x Populus x berolinensis]